MLKGPTPHTRKLQQRQFNAEDKLAGAKRRQRVRLKTLARARQSVADAEALVEVSEQRIEDLTRAANRAASNYAAHVARIMAPKSFTTRLPSSEEGADNLAGGVVSSHANASASRPFHSSPQARAAGRVIARGRHRRHAAFPPTFDSVAIEGS